METEVIEKSPILADKDLVRILLVEDNAIDKLLVEQVLTKCSQTIQFITDSVESSSTAIEYLSNKEYDVVLLDLMLPDSQGIETVKKVNHIAQNTPIVVLTVSDDEEMGLLSIKTGATDYLIKGQTLGDTLIRAIRYAIERKRTENALRKANEQLEEHDRMKSEFVANVSHELRTPLTIFKNILSNTLVGLYGGMNRKVKENLEIVDKNIDRLGRIINDFLEISTIEAGKLTLRLGRVNLQSAVFEVIESLKSTSEIKTLELKSTVPDYELFVNVDRDRLIEVLTNLIANAIKFGPDVGGCVTVRVKDLDDEVEVDVEDNGPGIEKNDVDRVFNRFVQVQKLVGPGEHGTGLGLPICKELVEMHGGRIWVESQPGQGANFCFTLPKSTIEEQNSCEERQSCMAVKQEV